MPGLAFGLSKGASKSAPVRPPKRPANVAFGEQEETTANDSDEETSTFGHTKATAKPLAASKHKINQPETKNLSALRNARLQDKQAQELDASVYDYDALYDQVSSAATEAKRKAAAANAEQDAVPKYMDNLLASATTRKRDLNRAKEKALQREREQEGDEFADSEKFVTSGYKKQQQENAKLEEEEAEKERLEEERKRRGLGGMTGFYTDVLKKDEARSKAVETAVKDSARDDDDIASVNPGYQDNKIKDVVAEARDKGLNIVTNDEGEIVDERQLLTAGLNVAPKKPSTQPQNKASANGHQPEYHKSREAHNARMSQRERQSLMMQKQIEDIERKQREVDEAEEKALEEKNKSKVTDEAKMGAKERYLKRKAEAEAAKKVKEDG